MLDNNMRTLDNIHLPYNSFSFSFIVVGWFIVEFNVTKPICMRQILKSKKEYRKKAKTVCVYIQGIHQIKGSQLRAYSMEIRPCHIRNYLYVNSIFVIRFAFAFIGFLAGFETLMNTIFINEVVKSWWSTIGFSFSLFFMFCWNAVVNNWVNGLKITFKPIRSISDKINYVNWNRLIFSSSFLVLWLSFTCVNNYLECWFKHLECSAGNKE